MQILLLRPQLLPCAKHKKATTKPVVLVRKDAPPVVEVAKAFAEGWRDHVAPVQTPATGSRAVSDPEGPCLAVWNWLTEPFLPCRVITSKRSVRLCYPFPHWQQETGTASPLQALPGRRTTSPNIHFGGGMQTTPPYEVRRYRADIAVTNGVLMFKRMAVIDCIETLIKAHLYPAMPIDK